MATIPDQLRGAVVRERVADILTIASFKASKILFKALLAATLATAAVIGLRTAGWLQPVELLIYDTLLVAWAGNATSDRVVLVGTTEADITAENGTRFPWPLPDDTLAAILERVASWQPRAIGVDIYRDIPIYRGVPNSEENPLDAVLKRHPEILWVFKLTSDAKHPGTAAPKLLRGTERAVFSDLVEDSDGVVRRALLYAEDGSNQYTGLGAALALAYLAREHVTPQPAAEDGMRLGKAILKPLDPSRGPYVDLDSRGYQLLLDYRGGGVPFREETLSAIMEHDRIAPLVRDRVVIIGVNAESVPDRFSTPFGTGFNHSEAVSGMTLHAHLADQLIRAALTGNPALDGLSRPAENMWICAWALLAVLLSLLVRSTMPFAIGAGAGVAAIGAIVYIAFGRAVWLPAAPAALTWIATAGLTNQILHAASNRARTRLRRSFEHYLPPAVIDRLVKADALPALGGERREISVLFTDVAGFTTFSEGRDPEELAEITNRYFDGVCAAVFAYEGLVNAFLGDGVLAFFGAPQEQPDHADRAVDAALSVDRFAQQFSVDQQARGLNFGQTRIGIHTGVAFVGNIGARDRLQYTALGDILNTCSRLEGLNKAIGSRICVSRELVEKCRTHRFRPIGEFIVMGRHEATEVYAPIDPDRDPPEALQGYASAYQALTIDPARAKADFAELHRRYPQDACIAFHHRRLADGESGKLIEMRRK